MRAERQRLIGAARRFVCPPQTMASSVAVAGAMGAAGKTMAAMNKRMEAADVRGSLRAFAIESERMGLTEEMLDDSLADAFADDDEEAEAEIVAGVLDEIGIDLRASLAAAPRGAVAAGTSVAAGGGGDPEAAVSEEETTRVLASLGIT
jgi:division protein CdvB (Snf7/Vps24/ESCRT-III family)